MQAAPEFPGGNDSLTKAGIVWDPFALIESVRRPGAHQVLTCECGYAPDAGLQEPVLVSHPDMSSVIWELDIPGLLPALDDAFDRDRTSFLRLVFARDQYEADIRARLCGLQHAGTTSFVTEALDSRTIGLAHLRSTYPACDSICVKTLEPDSQGLALERLMELDADGPWLGEPMWPAGTLIEFGFFPCGDGHDLIRVNGQLSGSVWPGRYLTRWHVLETFRAWLSHTRRAFALDSLFHCRRESVKTSWSCFGSRIGRVDTMRAGDWPQSCKRALKKVKRRRM